MKSPEAGDILEISVTRMDFGERFKAFTNQPVMCGGGYTSYVKK